MNDLDTFSFSDISINEEHSLTDSDFDQWSKGPAGVEYLSNVDYSINSPLIADELTEFTKYLLDHSYKERWSLYLWRQRQIIMKKSSLNFFIKSCSTDQFHHWFGRFNQRTKRDLTTIKELMKQSQQDSDITYPIVDAFFKGWLGRVVVDPHKD